MDATGVVAVGVLARRATGEQLLHARAAPLTRAARSATGNRSGLPPLRNRWFVDSSLEGPVLSEPVSEAKFLASWENTGNFVRLSLREQLLTLNGDGIQWLTGQFPTHRNREFISA